MAIRTDKITDRSPKLRLPVGADDGKGTVRPATVSFQLGKVSGLDLRSLARAADETEGTGRLNVQLGVAPDGRKASLSFTLTGEEVSAELNALAGPIARKGKGKAGVPETEEEASAKEASAK
jgi:hypothetical protein